MTQISHYSCTINRVGGASLNAHTPIDSSGYNSVGYIICKVQLQGWCGTKILFAGMWFITLPGQGFCWNLSICYVIQYLWSSITVLLQVQSCTSPAVIVGNLHQVLTRPHISSTWLYSISMPYSVYTVHTAPGTESPSGKFNGTSVYRSMLGSSSLLGELFILCWLWLPLDSVLVPSPLWGPWTFCTRERERRCRGREGRRGITANEI